MYILLGFFTIVVIVAIIIVLLRGILDVRNYIEENRLLIDTTNLAQVLLSSDKLCYADESGIHRGVFYEEKLEAAEDDPNVVFSDVYNPEVIYSLYVEDKEDDNSWYVSDLEETIIEKTFPVAIRYTNGETHVGMMTIKIGEPYGIE